MLLLVPHAKLRLRFPGAGKRRWPARGEGSRPLPSAAPAVPQLPAGRALPSPPRSTSDSINTTFPPFSSFLPAVSSAPAGAACGVASGLWGRVATGSEPLNLSLTTTFCSHQASRRPPTCLLFPLQPRC